MIYISYDISKLYHSLANILNEYLFVILFVCEIDTKIFLIVLFLMIFVFTNIK